jgi:hypothetical protein
LEFDIIVASTEGSSFEAPGHMARDGGRCGLGAGVKGIDNPGTLLPPIMSRYVDCEGYGV